MFCWESMHTVALFVYFIICMCTFFFPFNLLGHSSGQNNPRNIRFIWYGLFKHITVLYDSYRKVVRLISTVWKIQYAESLLSLYAKYNTVQVSIHLTVLIMHLVFSLMLFIDHLQCSIA